MVSEKVDETWFRKEVKRRGGWTVKWYPIQRGTPDRVVLWPGGLLYLVELKKDDTDLSPIQRWWHAKAAALGTKVVVLHGRKEAVAWLNSLPSTTTSESA